MATFNGTPYSDGLANGGTVNGSLDVTNDLSVGGDVSAANLTVADTIECDTLIANTYIVENELEVKDQTITMNAGALDDTKSIALLYEYKLDAGSRWAGLGRAPLDGEFYAFRDSPTKPDSSTDLTMLAGQNLHLATLFAALAAKIGPSAADSVSIEFGGGDDGEPAILMKNDGGVSLLVLSSFLTPNPRVDIPVLFEAYNTCSISRTGTDPALLRWLDDRHAVSPLFTLGLEAGDATKFLKLKNTAGTAVLQVDPATANLVVGDSTSVIGANGTWGFNQSPIILVDNAAAASTAGIILSDNPLSQTWRIGHNNGGGTDDFAIWKGLNVTRAMLIDSATSSTTVRDLTLDKQGATDVNLVLKRSNAQVVKWATSSATVSGLYNASSTQFLKFDTGTSVISNYIGWAQNGTMQWSTGGSGGTGQFIQEATTVANQLRFKTFSGSNNIMYLTNDGQRNTVIHAPVVCSQDGGTSTLKFQSAPSTDKTFFFQFASELRVDDVSGAHYIGLDQTTKALFVYTGLKVGTGNLATAYNMPITRATSAGQVLVDLSVAGTPVWGQGTLADTLSDVVLTGPGSGDVLTYNTGTNKWVNQTPVLSEKWDFAGRVAGAAAQYLNIGGVVTAVLSPLVSAQNTYIVPITGNLVFLSYYTTAGDTTSEFNIYVNGVGQGTFTLPSNTTGTKSLALAVAAGNTLGIAFTGTGTIPGSMNAQLHFLGS